MTAYSNTSVEVQRTVANARPLGITDGIIGVFDPQCGDAMLKKLNPDDLMAFATLGLFLGGPAVVSSLGVVRLLNGDLTGLLALGLPALLAWAAYETYSHWAGLAAEIKWVASSWLAGLPAGLAISTLLKGIHQLVA